MKELGMKSAGNEGEKEKSWEKNGSRGEAKASASDTPQFPER